MRVGLSSDSTLYALQSKAISARCIVTAPPLDLIFLLDSSGSLRNKFQDEIEVIRRIVQYVTIGKSATRVMLIQFRYALYIQLEAKMV